MEVILLEKIRNLGDIGDTVKVKAGFARNFLLPQGKVVSATTKNVAQFEKRRAELEAKAAESLASAKARAEKLAQLSLNVAMKASEEGNLFGSVGTREIVKAFAAHDEKVDKNEIIFPEGPIHQIGEFEINLQLHTDVIVPVKVNVVAEE